MAKIIGITGGIGTGKTAVSDYLAGLGYPIIDADVIARQVVEPGTIGLAQLVAFFGDEILLPDGALDRKALGRDVFAHEAHRRVLEAITHPLIDREVDRQLAMASGEQVFLVAPLLFETEMQERCDEVWLVTTDPERQLERIIARDEVDRDLAEKKVASQLSDDERLRHRPVVLRNDGGLPDLYRQVDLLLAKGGPA